MQVSLADARLIPIKPHHKLEFLFYDHYPDGGIKPIIVSVWGGGDEGYVLKYHQTMHFLYKYIGTGETMHRPDMDLVLIKSWLVNNKTRPIWTGQFGTRVKGSFRLSPPKVEKKIKTYTYTDDPKWPEEFRKDHPTPLEAALLRQLIPGTTLNFIRSISKDSSVGSTPISEILGSFGVGSVRPYLSAIEVSRIILMQTWVGAENLAQVWIKDESVQEFLKAIGIQDLLIRVPSPELKEAIDKL